jgi:hypothetical protein
MGQSSCIDRPMPSKLADYPLRSSFLGRAPPYFGGCVTSSRRQETPPTLSCASLSEQKATEETENCWTEFSASKCDVTTQGRAGAAEGDLRSWGCGVGRPAHNGASTER